jgi:hypothetical protein
MDTGLNHAPFELGEGAAYLEDQLAHRRRCVDRLLVDVEVDPHRLEVLYRPQQVDQGAAEPVDRPDQGDIEVPAAGVLEHPVEPRPVSPPLAAADAGIAVDFDHLPSAALGDLAQLDFLVLDGLLVGADAQIKRGAACHSLIPSPNERFPDGILGY